MSPIETKRQPCEVYSRVVGYLRPVQQWNDGKQAEYQNRRTFKIGGCGCGND
jgi:ribonucleoside-triphosphate reductase